MLPVQAAYYGTYVLVTSRSGFDRRKGDSQMK